MAEQSATRKLTAILAADMVGYSRLMEADETGTIERQKTHRAELIDPKITEYHGRIVKTTGDGLLVEFASVVDAVACAVEIQRAMGEREANVSEERRIQYRIGINLGDIVIDEDDIYGDGVNIAARLQELTEPGGVSVSGTAYEHLKAKVEVGYEYLGEQRIKNIEKPVPVYRALLDPEDAGKVIGVRRNIFRPWIAAAAAAGLVVLVAVGGLVIWQPWAPDVEPARADEMAFPLPDKPSIAVLPFDNLSGDPEEDYFVDGMTETLITRLSRIPNLFVIARNSVFTYEDKSVKVQQVAEDLGVRYVLEGSVQRSRDRVRVNAQLVDALSGRHLWAESYDREAGDVFALQDDITNHVATEMEVQLTEGEQARMARGQTSDPEAYDLYLRGQQHEQRYTEEDYVRAQQLYHQAVSIDPGFVSAWTALAWTYQAQARFGWAEDPGQARATAEDIALRAQVLDPEHARAYSLLGQISLFKREFDRAIEYCEKAIALAPESASVLAGCGQSFCYLGKPEEALRLIKRAMRLSPYYPGWYLFVLGNAHRLLGNYDEAIPALQAWQRRLPQAAFPHIVLTYTYAEMGRLEEARAEAQKLLEKWPDFSVEQQAKQTPYKDPSELELTLEGLRKAGIPERPPSNGDDP